MRVIANFRCCILFVLLLAPCIPLTALSAPLLIAVEDAAAQWSNKDGTGFANDVVRAAFKATGVEVELSVMPYVRCKDMVAQGKVAACFSMSWLPENAGNIVFADEPLFVCYSDYFTGNRKPLKATQEADLPKGTLLGIVSSYEYPPSVYALRDKGTLILEESGSEELNLAKLARGRLDIALVNYNETKPAELLLAQAGVTGQVKRAFRSGVLRSFIGFSTRHPQGTWAREKFNKGYRIISSNGVRSRIEQKWQTLALEEIAGIGR